MLPTLVLSLLVHAAPALACAVCGTGPDESNWAFLKGTALLSLMPLGFIGGGVFYFVRRNREAEAAEIESKLQ